MTQGMVHDTQPNDTVTASELIQYSVHSPTEQLGYIDQLSIDEQSWKIPSIRVSVDHSWVKKHIQIPCSFIERIDVSSRRVFLMESIQKIQDLISRQPPLHFHTVHDLKGFEMHTPEKNFGKLEDLLIHKTPQKNSWAIDHFILNIHRWFGWKYVLIRPDQIKNIAWNHSRINLALHESEVLNAPEFKHTDAPFQSSHWYG
jgi:hypothetical protein